MGLVLFLLLLVASTAQAQDVVRLDDTWLMEHWGTEDGWPGIHPTNLVLGSDGFCGSARSTA